jgi:hypothetical protein
MKKYRLWALEVPDLHPEGFKPRLGGMRLFDGGDGGGGDGGPGGTDTRDEGKSFGDIYGGPSDGGTTVSPADVAKISSDVDNRILDDFITGYPELSVGTTTPSVVDNVRRDEADRYGGSADLVGLPAATASPNTFAPSVYDVLDSFADRNVPVYTSPPPTPEKPSQSLSNRSLTSAPASSTAGLAALTTRDPSQAANTVRTGGNGFLVDSENNIVTSTAFPGQVNYEAPKPTIPDETLEKAATARKMTVDELREVIDQEVQSGAKLSTTGLDYGTLKAMQDAGMGGLDISPTQTVDQALASKTTSDFLDKYGQSIVSALGPPGTGLLLAANRGLGAIGSGQVTPGQGITDFGLGLVSATMGVPVGTLRGALNGDFGAAASTTVQGLLNQQLSKATGIPGLLTGILLQESGLGRAAGNLADEAVSGIIPDQNWGTTDLLSSGIDKGLTTIGDLFDFDLGAGAGTGSSSAGPDIGYDGGGRGGDNEAGTPPTTSEDEEEEKLPMVGGGAQEAFAGYTSRIPIRRYIVETPDGPQIKYDYAEIPIG